MGVRNPSIEERYSIALGCRVSVEAGFTATRVNWNIGIISGEDRKRPQQGSAVASFTCDRCRRAFCARVESRPTARRKRWIYLVVGAVLLLSLAVVVPMLVQLGGQTVDENDPDATDGFGLLFLWAFLAFVFGLSFFRVGWSYPGINKFRLVGADGRRSVWVKGHRLF
ncbi:hypothetical protein [Kitasatospora sp. NPDC005751]|uniref:hypothetical protein n=1 Tax=unclassified Kitasatospora TaxID=2633591 RepID=UPI0033CCC575